MYANASSIQTNVKNVRTREVATTKRCPLGRFHRACTCMYSHSCTYMYICTCMHMCVYTLWERNRWVKCMCCMSSGVTPEPLTIHSYNYVASSYTWLQQSGRCKVGSRVTEW